MGLELGDLPCRLARLGTGRRTSERASWPQPGLGSTMQSSFSGVAGHPSCPIRLRAEKVLEPARSGPGVPPMTGGVPGVQHTEGGCSPPPLGRTGGAGSPVFLFLGVRQAPQGLVREETQVSREGAEMARPRGQAGSRAQDPWAGYGSRVARKEGRDRGGAAGGCPEFGIYDPPSCIFEGANPGLGLGGGRCPQL